MCFFIIKLCWYLRCCTDNSAVKACIYCFHKYGKLPMRHHIVLSSFGATFWLDVLCMDLIFHFNHIQDSPLVIECYNFNSNGKHDLMGYQQFLFLVSCNFSINSISRLKCIMRLLFLIYQKSAEIFGGVGEESF